MWGLEVPPALVTVPLFAPQTCTSEKERVFARLDHRIEHFILVAAIASLLYGFKKVSEALAHLCGSPRKAGILRI
jgi:hypothetical protein